MATNQMSGFIQHLRRVLRDGAGLTDGQLLADYLTRRDEAAIAALVRRHGPMVWGVCRRVLRNHHDAEDAFQTTFLVLVRKAASIASRELLANWLYGVAHQTALKARATAAKRKERERQAAEMPEPAATQQDPWCDLQPLLDEELSRLPDKYRSVIVLCDLEGKTRKETARQLGCPEGTVAGRLARARIMLAKRLTRRGVALSGGALAAVLSQQATTAGVPTSVAASTIKAATLFAAGKAAATGAISVKVAALTEGVMKAMLFTKLKTVLAVVLILGFVATGATVLTSRTAAGQEDKPPLTEKPVKAAPKPADPPVQDKQGPADKLVDQPVKEQAGKPVVVQEDAQVRRLAWSSNGKILATIGIVSEFVEFRDGGGNLTGSGGVIPHSTIKLWDATTGELKRSLAEEKDTLIAAIAFSADGKTAAISTSKHVVTNQPKNPIRFETEVRVMDAQTWALKHKVKTDGFASALAFSPDGMSLALGGSHGFSDNAFVRLWDVQKQKMMGGTEDGGYRVHCLAFSIDGKQLATGDENGKVRLFDGRTGAARRDFAGHGPLRSGGEQCVTGVGFSADGKTLVSGSQDKTLKLWDVETGKLLRNLEGNKARVSALAFSPDGKLFATAGPTADSLMRGPFEVLLWDMNTGQPKKTFPEQTVPVNSLAFSPDGSTLAIGAGAGFNSQVNTETGRAQTPGEFKLWNLKLKKEKDKEDDTAWGKEAGGLQAGLGCLPGQHRTYHIGETVTLVVRVRNVSKEAVRFQYLRNFFMENPPTVTDGEGKRVHFRYGTIDLAEIHVPVDVNLAPGKEIELYELKFKCRPANESGNEKDTPFYGTGKFQIQYERVFGNSSLGQIKLDPALSKLGTGKLELEVKPDSEDRMLRWKMTFSTKDGKDYAKQLEALGATLAIPSSEKNQYRIICDLSNRPVKFTVEDRQQIQKIHHLFWVQNDAASLKALSEELGLSQCPEAIVVFLPKFIEDELLRKELAYANRAEQDIKETTFQFVFSKRGFDVKVASQRTQPSKSE